MGGQRAGSVCVCVCPPPAPLQPPGAAQGGGRGLGRAAASRGGHHVWPLSNAKGLTSGLYRRVFLPEDFRIYTDGRGGLAKSELAHIEVIVMPCVLHPISLRTEQLWERSRRKVQRRVPSAAVLCRALLCPNTVPSRNFLKAPNPFPGTTGNQAHGVQMSMWLIPVWRKVGSTQPAVLQRGRGVGSASS